VINELIETTGVMATDSKTQFSLVDLKDVER